MIGLPIACGDTAMQREGWQMTKVESERLVLYPISDTELRKLIDKESDAELKQAYSEMLHGAITNKMSNYEKAYVKKRSFSLLDKDLPEPDIKIGKVKITKEYKIKQYNDWVKKGYMTEAVKAMCEWALSQEGVTRIEAETTAENKESQRVLYSSGFIPTGAYGDEGPRFISQ